MASPASARRTVRVDDRAQWQRRQDAALGIHAPALITGSREAERFLARVGIALRYGATKDLPLASLYRSFAGPAPDRAHLAKGIALTNHLLGEGCGIEVHVIADRVTLVHRSLVPALYALVRRGRAAEDLEGLSLNARTALQLVRALKQASAGEVRERLGGKKFDPRNDPAYAALGELTRALLVDRGPFEIPSAGIPYLSTEGYPYHLFHEAHRDLALAARQYSLEQAADEFLATYLSAAVFVRVRKLASLFRLFLSAAEIDASLSRLAARGPVRVAGDGSTAYALSAS